MTVPHTTLILLTITAGLTLKVGALAYPEKVVDPSTGEALDLSALDFATLSQSEALAIVGQLQDQSRSPVGAD